MAPRPLAPAIGRSDPRRPSAGLGAGGRVALTEDPGAGASSRGTSNSSRRISVGPAGEAGSGAGGAGRRRRPTRPRPARRWRPVLAHRRPAHPQRDWRGRRGSQWRVLYSEGAQARLQLASKSSRVTSFRVSEGRKSNSKHWLKDSSESKHSDSLFSFSKRSFFKSHYITCLKTRKDFLKSLCRYFKSLA